MTPELSQRLESILAFLETSVKQGAEFAADQAPELVQQILTWNFTISLICFVSWILCGLLMSSFSDLMSKVDSDGVVFFGFGAVVSFGLAICSHAWLKIMIAPKLFLLEYATSFLSK